MILKYFGHSFFTITLESGKVIALDPYGDFYRYPKRAVAADLCLISHHHHDHDGVSSLLPGARIMDAAGHARLDGICITGVPTWHDVRQGALRGPNLVHVVEAEGLRVAHAGDLGHVPDQEQLRQIGRVDVLLLPVGGCYTIDAQTAMEVCRLIRPMTVIPMHYRTVYDEEMPISGPEDFLRLAKAEDTQMPLARIAKADVCERPRVFTLAVEPASGGEA